jgi:hypothetical protein
MIFAGTTIKNACPNDEVFIKAFMHELSLDENEHLIDHTLVCVKCHKKFEALRLLSEELSKKKDAILGKELSKQEETELKHIAEEKLREFEKSDKKKSSNFFIFKFIPARYIAVAAAIVIVFMGYIFVSRVGKKDVYREDMKVGLRQIEPTGVISEIPVVFKWTAYEGTDDYWFELIDSDLNTVLEARLTESRLTLPLDVRQRLKIGITYVWRVTARDEFGNVLSSTFTSFELK